MYRIEKIKKDNLLVELIVKNENHYEIINVCEKELFDIGIFSPGIISYNIFERLKKSQINKKNFNLAFCYCSKKRRTVLEVTKILKKVNILEKEINLIINTLKKYNYLNDNEYLYDFVDYHINIRMNGPKKIRHILSEKFEENFFLRYLDEVYTKDKIEYNLEMIHKELIKKEYLSLQDYKKKIINKCIYKGYSYESLLNFLGKVNFDGLKIKINIDNIQNIAKRYNNKLISAGKLNVYERKRKLYNYLLMKKINQDIIQKIVSLLFD